MNDRKWFWYNVKWKLQAPWRWLQFWSGYLRCPIGWHQYRVFYITDGATNVWCIFCRKKRDATSKELADHPNVDMTPEQQAEHNVKVQEMVDWLDEHWDQI